MGIIRFTQRKAEEQPEEEAGRFEERLEALSRTGRRPLQRRESLFDRVRNQASHQEA